MIECSTGTVDAESLGRRVESLAARLRVSSTSCVALLADNSADWIVADLACLEANVRIVPVPLFFSPAQIRHVLDSSGADTLLTDRPVGPLRTAVKLATSWPQLPGLHRYSLQPRKDVRLPAGTWKITYTSGTTGTPKGVCLSASSLQSVAGSLANASGLEAPRHLCVLPLSTLLENVAGVYAPLRVHGTVVVPSLAEVGLEGSSSIDIERLLDCITLRRPDSIILVPEILRLLTIAAERGWLPPSSLRFAAVGGSRVSPALLKRAHAAGLPVYEGYGLSECGSVVTLNTADRAKPGTAGRALPHARLRIDNGEIVVSGSAMLGYVDQPDSWYPQEIRSGDLGAIDSDGFVHIEGRATNLLITSYGRNLSPEWVESELLAGQALRQAIVVGDARPWCTALVFASGPDVRDAEIDAWLRQVNQRLPDYARIADWRRLPEPLTTANGLLTTNGRPRRAAIESQHESLIEELYASPREAINQ
jgi:long-subunit acyl-CoA synthetase (AMP-forming)